MDIKQISEKFQLSNDELSVLKFMQSQGENLKKLGIRDVAKETYTSPSFIIKIAHKMKLSGFAELVFLLTNTLSYTNDIYSEIDEYSHCFIKLVKKHCHDIFVILANGYSQNIANYMCEYLNIHGFRAITNSHLEFLRNYEYHQENCLIFAISNSGETLRLNDLILEAKNNQHDIISFIGNSSSTIAKNSTLSISTNTFVSASYDQNIPQLFFGKALIYFELLMSKALNSLNDV